MDFSNSDGKQEPMTTEELDRAMVDIATEVVPTEPKR